MAKKTESTLARGAYKLAILEALQEILDVQSDGDAAVEFWREEARKPLERQIAKLAAYSTPEVKVARTLDGCTAIAVERDALLARVRVLEGQLASDKRAAGSREGWERCAALEVENSRLLAELESRGWFDNGYAEPFFSEGT
jgi:hypothetical protein